MKKFMKLRQKLERKEGEDSKEGEELEVPTEITSENKDIVDKSVFKEMWGKLTIGKTLDR